MCFSGILTHQLRTQDSFISNGAIGTKDKPKNGIRGQFDKFYFYFICFTKLCLI